MVLKGVVACLIAAVTVSPVSAQAKLLGGAGREAIAITLSTLTLARFTRVDDPHQARVVALDDVLVIASYTFSSPHAFEPGYLPPGSVMAPDDPTRAPAYQGGLLDDAQKAETDAAANLVPIWPARTA